MKKPDLCTVCLIRPQALAGIVNTGATGFFVKASWCLSDCKWFSVAYEVIHSVRRRYLYFCSSSVQYIAICKYFILYSSWGVSCQMIPPLPFWAIFLSCLGLAVVLVAAFPRPQSSLASHLLSSAVSDCTTDRTGRSEENRSSLRLPMQ